MSMRRVIYDGVTVNQRTANMLKRAEKRLGYKLDLSQGSYNDDVAPSGGTHDGGGAVDISVRNVPNIPLLVLVLREVGFAAWYRSPSEGPWPAHVHAIAIGDPELSPQAAAQVTAYKNRRNGLANNASDTGPMLEPIPEWPIPTPKISLGRSQFQFMSEEKRSVPAVKRIQRLLNRRLNENLLVDGIAGPMTTAAYKRWEEKIGRDNPDGIPGEASLKKLVSGYYHVVN